MKNKTLNLGETKLTIVYQSTINEEELAKMGYKLFKHVFQVNSTTIQFLGNPITHEISVMFRFKDSENITILASGKKTDDCVGDKRSFLQSCFASAYGKYFTYQLNKGCALAGNEIDITCYSNELNRF